MISIIIKIYNYKIEEYQNLDEIKDKMLY